MDSLRKLYTPNTARPQMCEQGEACLLKDVVLVAVVDLFYACIQSSLF